MLKKIQIESFNSYVEYPISEICDVLCVKSQHARPVIFINDRGTGYMKVLCIAAKQTQTNAPEGFHYLGTVLFDNETFEQHYFYRIRTVGVL